MDGYEELSHAVSVWMIAIVWLTERYAIKQRPLSFFEILGACLVGFYTGHGLAYMYTHPSIQAWWSLIDVGALIRAYIAITAVVMPILIIIVWAGWLAKKLSKDGSVPTD